jgi:hypothetical protein
MFDVGAVFGSVMAAIVELLNTQLRELIENLVGGLGF